MGGFFLFVIMLLALAQSSLFLAAIFIGRINRYNPRYRFDNVNQPMHGVTDYPAQTTNYQQPDPNVHARGYVPVTRGPPTLQPSYSDPHGNKYQQPKPYEVRPSLEEPYLPEDPPYDPKLSSPSKPENDNWNV